MEEIVYEMDLEEKKLFDMFKKYNLRKVEFNPVWGEVAFYFEDSNGSRVEPVIVMVVEKHWKFHMERMMNTNKVIGLLMIVIPIGILLGVMIYGFGLIPVLEFLLAVALVVGFAVTIAVGVIKLMD